MMPCDHPPVPLKTVAPIVGKASARMVRPYAAVVAIVDDKGHVIGTNIDVSSGSADYDRAALTAMRAWTFLPAAAGCQSLPGESEFTVGGNDATFADPCNHEAQATKLFTPELPDVMQKAQVPVHGEAIVFLDQFGELTKIQVSRSTGNAGLDERLKRAAMASNYLPKVKGCMPVPGTYLFSMDANL